MSKSVVKWNEGLSNRASIIIRTYIDQMKFIAYVVLSFYDIFSIFFWFYFVLLYIWFYVL